MNTLWLVGWIVIGEAIIFWIAFVFFANFCQRILAALLALLYVFRDARSNFRSHFRRLLDRPTHPTVLPMLVTPYQIAERETPTEEMVIKALVQQGAARKKAQKIVMELRGQGLMTFEQLFRKAASMSTGRNRTGA